MPQKSALQKGKKLPPAILPQGDFLPDPVLRPLASQMEVDLVVKEDGRIFLLHDKPFRDILNWVEFDRDRGVLSLVTQKGRTQDLGMDIPEDTQDFMLETQNISLWRMQDGQIADMYILPFLVRNLNA
ncbi:MAG: hypothetical protein KDJ15_01395 [Alphaproteobacteria bacterium]|nr:hypothetical protein [Alphaproteobacteria bacterium]